jgi:hypothetical protein
MSNLEQTILDRLGDTQGNVTAVARELSVSVSYVNRIKKANDLSFVSPDDVGPSSLIVPASPVSAADVSPKSTVGKAAEVIAPNILAVTRVRDLALSEMTARIAQGEISVNGLTNLLKAVLAYETKLREVAVPTVTNITDARTQNVHLYQLVDKLAQADPETLRELAGVPSAQLIEGDFTEENE